MGAGGGVIEGAVVEGRGVARAVAEDAVADGAVAGIAAKPGRETTVRFVLGIVGVRLERSRGSCRLIHRDSRETAIRKAPRITVFVAFQAVARVKVSFWVSRQTATTVVSARKTKNIICGRTKLNGDRLDDEPVTCQPTSLPEMTLTRALV